MMLCYELSKDTADAAIKRLRAPRKNFRTTSCSVFQGSQRNIRSKTLEAGGAHKTNENAPFLRKFP
jgi:hypothetical protein